MSGIGVWVAPIGACILVSDLPGDAVAYSTRMMMSVGLMGLFVLSYSLLGWYSQKMVMRIFNTLLCGNLTQ
jgi:hypothetical protein